MPIESQPSIEDRELVADPARGDRATAGQVPGTDRALLPGGHDSRPGRPRAGLAGRDGPGPAGAGTRSPEVAPHSPRPGTLRRACGLGSPADAARRACRPRWSKRRSGAALGRSRAAGLLADGGTCCSRPSSATWPSPDGSLLAAPLRARRFCRRLARPLTSTKVERSHSGERTVHHEAPARPTASTDRPGGRPAPRRHTGPPRNNAVPAWRLTREPRRLLPRRRHAGLF